MASLRDDDDDSSSSNDSDSTVDLSDAETHTFGRQFTADVSSGWSLTDEDVADLQSLDDTEPFDDDFSIEDFFDTQLVNIGGDTQAVDLSDETETQVTNLVIETQVEDLLNETQVVDLGGECETQVMDYAETNETQLINDLDTQIVADTDDEGSIRTEVLCDTKEESDHSSLKDVSDKVQSETISLSNGVCHSGSAPRGFTSPRTANGRAAGLAARDSVLKRANSRSHSTTSLTDSMDKQSTSQDGTPVTKDSSKLTDEIDRGNTTMGEYVEQTNATSDKNKSRSGSSAVRKLFADDDDGLDDTENGLAGLSYVDSQEPGEFSQAKALDFVDKYIKVNAEEFDQGVNLHKTDGKKSKPVSNAKGTQMLAKNANLLSCGGGKCPFDWDDSLEDEGGGEFFQKKKEVFFGDRKPKSNLKPKSGKACEQYGKGDKMLKKSTKTKFRKNLIKEFDEEFKACSNDKVVETAQNADMQDMTNVGFDTQMAAEAMEALCSGLGGAPHIANDDANQAPKVVEKNKETKKNVSRTAKKKATKMSEEPSKPSTRSSTRVGKSRSVKEVDENITCQDAVASEGQCGNFTPVARRTRQKNGSNESKRNSKQTGVDTLDKDKSADVRTRQNKEPDPELSKNSIAVNLPIYPKRKRTTRSNITKEAYEDSLTKSKKSKAESTSVAPVNLVTPSHVNSATPSHMASPIIMGDEYPKQLYRKNFTRSSAIRELNSLNSSGRLQLSSIKDTRKRRDMASVKVVFSRHLDKEIINHQNKILARLGASVASSMSDATHFIADEFVRTRNMLDAIALAKPVVTPLWLESCGEAKCLLDEKTYILRDAKKEKEFGFNLPYSLERACKNPLLKGQRVFITPNTKPGLDILAGLIKAAHGLVVERVGRSAMKDDKIPDDLMVLSCVEDYDVCVPFLEKGADVYSSELLLNGIVTQKLDYDRHRLFLEHVKKTRSTIWLRKERNKFQTVARSK